MLEELLLHVYDGKQAALASALGVHESTVWRWLRGTRPRSRGRATVERLYAEELSSSRGRRYASAAADFLASTKERPC